MAVIHATKKLLDRTKKWGITHTPIEHVHEREAVLSDWYATYEIMCGQHVVVLMNDPTLVTLVVPLMEFKRSPQAAMQKALALVLEEFSITEDLRDASLATWDHVTFTTTNSRSLLSRLRIVLDYIAWRLECLRTMDRINIELLAELHGSIKDEDMPRKDYQTSAYRLCRALQLDLPDSIVSRSTINVHMVLQGTQPPVSRLVQLPATTDLLDLHLAIQTCMEWQDKHLHQFIINKSVVHDEFSIMLLDLVKQGVTTIDYIYDFGDYWQLTLTIGGRNDRNVGYGSYHVLQAEHPAPPEDVGGVGGFERFLSIMSDPSHPDHAEARAWYGRSFNTNHPDPYSISQRLGHVRVDCVRRHMHARNKTEE